MEKRIYEKDWSETPLGRMEDWPAILTSAVNLILDINFPIGICWGEELTIIYNDAYRPLLGDKPEALGRQLFEVWPEVKHITKPQVARALNGQPGYYENAEFSVKRYDQPEKAWFDYTFSPIRDADGEIKGIINLAVEVTEKIQVQKELKKMNKTLEQRVEQRTAKLEDYKNQLRILTYQLNKAEEQERHRLARVLHDHLGQLLDLSVIKLDQMKKEMSHNNLPAKIGELKEIILMANKYTRELVNELKPPPLFEKENIVGLLQWLAQRMKKYGLKIRLEDDGKPKPLNEEEHKILYQSVRELFFNIVKHAGVNEAKLTLRKQNNQIQIVVDDDGKGFDMKGKKLSPTDKGGFGLFNIQERMDMLGGRLVIDTEPGKGTNAILNLPLKNCKETVSLTSDKKLQNHIRLFSNKEATPWTIDYEQPNIYDPNQLSLPLKDCHNEKKR
ncbi:MAG TPA: ATP-binding protein [Balneolaceae bacterium]|nr:ATP-binding protein [Balneolaceae bacterium]